MPFAALTGFGESIVETAGKTTASVLEEEKCRFNPDHDIEPDSENNLGNL